MLILGIETSCDETSAAVVEETGDPERPWAIRSNVIASQVLRSIGNGAASCPSSRRGSTFATSAGSSNARSQTPQAIVERSGRHRGHAGAGPGRIAAGRRRVRQGVRGGRRPAARRGSSSGRTHRVARPAERRAAAPGRRARRVGRPHEPVSRARSPASTSFSAAPETMRRGKRTTRWRSCWASAIRAARSIDRLAQGGNDRAVALPTTRLTHADRNAPDAEGRSRLQLQRAEDGGAALRPQKGRTPRESPTPLFTESEIADICASFQRVVVTALIDRLFDAARRHQARSIGIAGGVSANSRLRAELAGAWPLAGDADLSAQPVALDRQRRDDRRRRPAEIPRRRHRACRSERRRIAATLNLVIWSSGYLVIDWTNSTNQ